MINAVNKQRTFRPANYANSWLSAIIFGGCSVLPLVGNAMGVSIAAAGYDEVRSATFPGIATSSDSGPDGGSPTSVAYSSSATASPGGISVTVSATGFAPSPGYTARGSFSSAADTTFDYAPDFQGGQSDWVEFGLGGFLTGTIIGQGLGGTGSASASITISGPIYDAPNGIPINRVFASSGLQGGSVRSFDDSQVITVNKSVSTGFYAVPRGESIAFTIEMSATAAGDTSYGNVGTVTANFADTFKLNADAVFTILTPGITVNSPSAGIVNNALPAPVPVPGAFMLLFPAVAALCTLPRRGAR